MLAVTELEPRDTPAGLESPLFAPGAFAEARAAFAGVESRYAPYIDAAGEAGLAFYGGPGAGPRVILYAEGAAAPAADFFVPGFDPAGYRGGLDILSIPDALLVKPDAAARGGAVVTAVGFDGGVVGGPYLPLGDPDYRGGVTWAAGDLGRDGRFDLTVTADTGDGRARVVTVDAMTGAPRGSFFAPGPVGFVPAGYGVYGAGIALDLPDGSARVYLADGTPVTQ